MTNIMTRPRVYADFHNADPQGRVRLNTRGTLDDLARQQVSLSDGLWVTLYSEDVEADAEVCFSEDESLWTAIIDWDAIREFEDVELPASAEDEHD
jgi:hypothetical protein